MIEVSSVYQFKISLMIYLIGIGDGTQIMMQVIRGNNALYYYLGDHINENSNKVD